MNCFLGAITYNPTWGKKTPAYTRIISIFELVEGLHQQWGYTSTSWLFHIGKNDRVTKWDPFSGLQTRRWFWGISLEMIVLCLGWWYNDPCYIWYFFLVANMSIFWCWGYQLEGLPKEVAWWGSACLSDLGQDTMRAGSELSATELCRNLGVSVSQKTRPLMKKRRHINER